MRVALVGPDLEENLSIRYLAAALRVAGHEPLIVPFDMAGDLPRVVEGAADAELVALSMCYQVRAPEFLTLARALKQQAPARPVVAGGHFASCTAEELLGEFEALDLVVIHEGEHTLVELAHCPALTPEHLQGIAGIMYRGNQGLVRTAARRTVEDLDTLPWPDRSGPTRLIAGVPSAYLMGSRGCVAACDYCAITTLHRMAPGKKFRQRAPAKIAEEMAALYHDRGIRQFVFHDDNFLVPDVDRNLQRIDALDHEIRQRGLRHIGLVLKCRPDDVHEPVLRRLREMGLLRVFLGIESGSDQGLASLGRRQTPQQAHQALRICEDLGISSQYTIILFHPEANVQSLHADLAFVRAHPAHPLSFCRAEAYAGTPLEQRMLAAGRAQGRYLARTYHYSEPTTERLWQVMREVLDARCWAPDNLLGQVIRLDHLATTYRHFFDGRDVDRAVGEFLQWQHKVNLDTVDLLDELVQLAAVDPGLDSPATMRTLDAIRQREGERARTLIEQACAHREFFTSEPYRKLGLERTVTGSRVHVRAKSRLPAHARVAVLAASLAQAGMLEGCPVIEAPPPPLDSGWSEDAGDSGDASLVDADGRDIEVQFDGGVIEAPPPPLDSGVEVDTAFVDDGGVIEAPPPPLDSGFIDDGGVIEAPPPPMDSGVEGDVGFIDDGGVIEAPPPPLDSGLEADVGYIDDGGVIEAPPPPLDSGPDDIEGND